MNDDADWLSGLVTGSEVAVMARSIESIETVDRVTKTQIVVGNSKYRVSDGRRIGGDSWSYVRLVQVTQNIRDMVELRRLRFAIGKYVESKDATIDVVRAMWSAKKVAKDAAP